MCPDDNHAKFHACASPAAQTFNPPRTADGKPDLSGYWRRRVAAFEDLEAHPRTPDDGGGPDVVVDPPDGKVPMQPWADARRKENAAKYLHHNAGCFLAGAVGTMYMANLYQFLQTPDHFVVVGEGLSAHPYRILPLDGRPHIGADIRLWQGDPVGRWDGNTLVIETTSQNGKPFVDQRGRFYTEDVRTVERLTLVDPNTLHFAATIEDPNVYTRPLTIAFAFRRNAVAGAEVWEEACYEANEEQMQLVPQQRTSHVSRHQRRRGESTQGRTGGSTMTRRGFDLAIAAGAIGLLLAIAPVRAHHSVAAGFDMEKTTRVVGTITKMEWRNPHARLSIGVKNQQGEVESWDVWFSSANGLYRRGWRDDDLPVGADVTVTGFRARDGSRQLYGGGDTKLSDGRVLFGGDAPAEGR